MAQEALNNVRRHAGVKKAELFITVTPTDVLLVIKDEGRGFVIDNDVEFTIIWATVNSRSGDSDWVVQLTG